MAAAMGSIENLNQTFRHGPVQVGPSFGNTMFDLSAPESGELNPAPTLSYNSRFNRATPLGRSVFTKWASTISDVGSGVAKHVGADGTEYYYTRYDSSTGKYINPPGVQDTLVKKRQRNLDAKDRGWTNFRIRFRWSVIALCRQLWGHLDGRSRCGREPGKDRVALGRPHEFRI